MINDQVRRGIKIACINRDTTILVASRVSGVPKSAIYRYTGGSGDIQISKLDMFCRLGLGYGLMEILELGKQ